MLVVLRSDRPLMPYRRRITIRWQFGGGPLQLPRSSGTRWSSSSSCVFGVRGRYLVAEAQGSQCFVAYLPRVIAVMISAGGGNGPVFGPPNGDVADGKPGTSTRRRIRLVKLPPLLASGAFAILACVVPRRRRRASVSGSSASWTGAWMNLRSASGKPRSCVCPRVNQCMDQNCAEPAQPGQQDRQRPVVVRVPRRPCAGHSAAAFHDQSEVAAIGLDVVLGIHGTAMVINQMHESHTPIHRWVMSHPGWAADPLARRSMEPVRPVLRNPESQVSVLPGVRNGRHSPVPPVQSARNV